MAVTCPNKMAGNANDRCGVSATSDGRPQCFRYFICQKSACIRYGAWKNRHVIAAIPDGVAIDASGAQIFFPHATRRSGINAQKTSQFDIFDFVVTCTNQVYCQEPFAQRRAGFMKYCPRSDGCLLAARCTLKHPLGRAIAMACVVAVRTNKSVRPSQRNQGLMAFALSAKIFLKHCRAQSFRGWNSVFSHRNHPHALKSSAVCKRNAPCSASRLIHGNSIIQGNPVTYFIGLRQIVLVIINSMLIIRS